MGEFLISLAELCRLPLQGGFAELDTQIAKLRNLRDSYQAQPAAPRPDRIVQEQKGGDQLCLQ